MNIFKKHFLDIFGGCRKMPTSSHSCCCYHKAKLYGKPHIHEFYHQGSPEKTPMCYGQPRELVKILLLLEKFLRRVRTLWVVLRATCNSPVHSNGVINYAIAAHLFRTVLHGSLKNFPGTIMILYSYKYNIIVQIFFMFDDNRYVKEGSILF